MTGPCLTVIVPAWNATPELATMTVETLAQVRRVASVPTQLRVIDNGSAYWQALPSALADRVTRWPENRGIAAAWNHGAYRADPGSVLCWLNSDCTVQPGWDTALVAATEGFSIAFPYTDHGDGQGYQRPDTGGVAGWCFAASLDTFRRVGRFDETFSPAFWEDTDWFHRAWEAGAALRVVPAAHVHHVRRQSAQHLPRLGWLFNANRLRYHWQHDVPLEAPPPFYGTPTDWR